MLPTLPVTVYVTDWPGASFGVVQLKPLTLVPAMVTDPALPPLLARTPESPVDPRAAATGVAVCGPVLVTVSV